MSDISKIRETVCSLNIDLVRYGLVAWTAGNVSERLPDGNSFIIKPSGVLYDDLKPEDLVICDLQGEVLEGVLAPSSDTKTHAYIYRNMPSVQGIVHTHSNYASAWAAANKSIPCALTAMGDDLVEIFHLDHLHSLAVRKLVRVSLKLSQTHILLPFSWPTMVFSRLARVRNRQ